VSDIIKTWPAFMEARKVASIFSPRGCFARYYFTLGRGKPKLQISRIWFTWRGRIIGSFAVEAVVCNDGSLPTLSRIDGEPSEWQIRKDAWVAVCTPGCGAAEGPYIPRRVSWLALLRARDLSDESGIEGKILRKRSKRW
jgi:hypothetical protein